MTRLSKSGNTTDDLLPLRMLVVLGTRPECIKLAPIIRKAPAFGVEIITCSTGQHQQMLKQCLDIFRIVPDFDLTVMRNNQSLAGLTGRILDGIAPVLDSVRPDLVVVQGDTTTAFSAALAAFYKRIPVAHIEAGLRTYDLSSPFPEEAMRQMISRISTWHFAPTEKNRDALLSEQIDKKSILVTGNTVIDSLFWMRDMIRSHSRRDLLEIPSRLVDLLSDPERKLVLITGHRRENFGTGIRDICRALSGLANDFQNVTFVYPVHMNPNVVGPVREILGKAANVHLLGSLNYYTFVYLMSRSHFIISDSGGVQEEAPSLGVPVLVTRAVTERMEAVRAGTVKLIGCDPDRIRAEAYQLLTDPDAYKEMTEHENPYGDGRAADRILGFMEQNCARQMKLQVV